MTTLNLKKSLIVTSFLYNIPIMIVHKKASYVLRTDEALYLPSILIKGNAS